MRTGADAVMKKSRFVLACLVLCVFLALPSALRAGSIHDAVSLGDTATVRKFLSAQPHLINDRESLDGQTPLAVAVGQRDKEMARFLLDNGADPNLADLKGVSPLCIAVRHNDRAMVDLLLGRGADVNRPAQASYDISALHVAVQHDNPDLTLIRTLLAKGAEPNAKDKDGITPLHVAAFRNLKDVVELLVLNKADINAKTNDGKTPMDLAAKNGNFEVVEYLKNLGPRE
jgi:cytohesin